MTGQKEHCDHECVCPDYKAGHSENGEQECYGDPEPCKLSCYHRSKSPELDLVKRTSDLPKIIPPLPEGDTTDLKVWKEYWVKHDANTRNVERLKLLKELEEDIQGVSDTLFGFLPVTDSVNKAGLKRWIEFKRKEVCK